MFFPRPIAQEKDDAIDPLILPVMHSHLLGDRRRAEAFQSAIARTVRPGDVVVDVGSGTGILALFACQAGAARVYAIERQRSLVPVIERLARANGYADRLVVRTGEACDIELPERADVLVSELIGQFGVDEGAVHILADAAARFLRPGGRLVPATLDVFVTPVESSAVRDAAEPWTTGVLGLDLSAARPWFASALHAGLVSREELLGQPRTMLSVTLGASPVPPRTWIAEAEVDLERDGTLNALAGWFSLGMAPGLVFSTAPGEPATHWYQALLPLAEPLTVRSGDRLRFTIAAMLDPAAPVWSWRGHLEHGGRSCGSFEHSTLEAVAVPPSSATPDPTWRIEAAREITTAIDGRTTIAALADHLAAKFAGRYPSRERALSEVAAILEALA